MNAQSAQADQAKLVEQAMKMPGIAEVLKAYAPFQQFAPQPSPPPPAVRFATGGNN